MPTPTNGAPPPLNDEADWLDIPPIELEELDPVEEPVALPGEDPAGEVLPPKPLDPEDEEPKLRPNDDDEDDDEEEEDVPVGVPELPILEADDAFAPRLPEELGNPASGWPKNPLTVVFASPT